jgi:hypothetical protein
LYIGSCLIFTLKYSLSSTIFSFILFQKCPYKYFLYVNLYFSYNTFRFYVA